MPCRVKGSYEPTQHPHAKIIQQESVQSDVMDLFFCFSSCHVVVSQFAEKNWLLSSEGRTEQHLCRDAGVATDFGLITDFKCSFKCSFYRFVLTLLIEWLLDFH